MGYTDTSWPHQRWEFSQHPLAHQKLSLRRMWIQDKGAAEISIPISNTRNLKLNHIVGCIEVESEIASLRMATKYQRCSSSPPAPETVEVVLQSPVMKPVLGSQRKPPKKRKKPQIKSKPRKRSKKIRDEMASKPSPLLKFGFKKIKKSWCMCFHGYPFENWENHRAYRYVSLHCTC